MKYRNIYSLLKNQAEKYSGRRSFFTRTENGWEGKSWAELLDDVHLMAAALRKNGLEKGDAVAILAGNCYEWTLSDLAAITAGGIGVGIYPTASAEQCEYIINHSEAAFLILDSAERLESLDTKRLPGLKKILVIKNLDKPLDERAIGFSEFKEQGRGEIKRLEEITEEAAAADPQEIAIIVYTSGTTGKPKGAMLSHKYVLCSIESLARSVPIFETDRAFSYLPGCHVAERISGIYNRLAAGADTFYVEDISRLNDYFNEVMPTVFASLPRFFEKIRSQLISRFGEAVAAEAVKNAFGGRIRLLTSGGAPLASDVFEFFARAGLPILTAYGLTENVCVAFNTFKENKPETVGKPMPMCDVRIAEDGEIEVRSEMMFSGYYKDPQATKEIFTNDGWLKTGDLGRLDTEGFLSIVGRKKELIVLSTGKKVAPLAIESMVKQSHLVSHCFLFGEGKSFCTALITINQAEARGLRREEIETEISKAVGMTNERVSTSEQIKKYKILERDFSIESGEVTPTGKLRRDIITRNFKKDLEGLYEN